ncbi:MAG: DNA methylase [Candidatus Roizmanbacteria bacterium]|nr:MAG: DNA methylase [Candidatus Roizmanbacteria bacterium]
MKKKIFSKDLGINLESKKESELFKWFLACLLFGKPIQQEVAKRTYFEFVLERLVTPKAILKAGWDKLVRVLDKGHYVRYDYSTAAKLIEICQELKKKYGKVINLIKKSKNKEELVFRLKEFKGIGEVTARIFLRDIDPVFRVSGGH